MSYKALYRTYRPQQFNDVVGQEHIVKTLENIINAEKVSHAYLFSGPRGTGKTSAAHVFAKNLNCIDQKSKTILCEKCESCTTRNNLDIVEIDAASNNGVSEIRNLIDNSKYAPSISKYKVYIIDEVHMLSKGAFNALLKTLEEPPAHVVFILATTEPHKIPVTILSRTQRFNFKRINNKEIIQRLEFVLGKEQITYDEESLRLISKLAKGGMRDALSIADQASAYANGKIEFTSLSRVFGIASNSELIQLLNNTVISKTKEVLSMANNFINQGKEISRIIEALISILKDFVFYKKTADTSLLEALSVDEVQRLGISNKFAYDALDILVKVSSDLRITEVPTQVYELGLLKLLDLTPQTTSSEVKIFETQEISKQIETSPKPGTQEIVEEIKSVQDKIDQTMELALNDQALEEVETDEESEILQEEILDKNSFKNTDELNIEDLFAIDDEEKQEIAEEKVKAFSIDEILNLLVQTNREKQATYKNLWDEIEIRGGSNNRNFINLLQRTSLISSSEDFLLVVSIDANVIQELNRVRKDDMFVQFINRIFGKPLLLFAITKEEFEEVKTTWINLSNSQTLPTPRPIEKLTLTKGDVDPVEEFGTSIFGELFNS